MLATISTRPGVIALSGENDGNSNTVTLTLGPEPSSSMDMDLGSPSLKPLSDLAKSYLAKLQELNIDTNLTVDELSNYITAQWAVWKTVIATNLKIKEFPGGAGIPTSLSRLVPFAGPAATTDLPAVPENPITPTAPPTQVAAPKPIFITDLQIPDPVTDPIAYFELFSAATILYPPQNFEIVAGARLILQADSSYQSDVTHIFTWYTDTQTLHGSSVSVSLPNSSSVSTNSTITLIVMNKATGHSSSSMISVKVTP